MHEKVRQPVINGNIRELQQIAMTGTVNVRSCVQFPIYYFTRDNNHVAVELLLEFNGDCGEAIEGHAHQGK